MLLAALNLLVPIGVLVAAIDNRVFNAGCGEWLGMYVVVGGFVLSQVVDRQQHPEIARNTLQKKLPKRQLFFNYFSSNEWITTPERSFGSNHVVFGGMMLPVSAILMSCCIETG